MKKILLALAITSMFTACTKPEKIDVSKTKFLMDGYWEMKGSTYNPDINNPSNTDVSNYDQIQDCRKDNLYKFQSPSVFTLYEGDLKCDVTKPDSTNYYWYFTSGETSILVYSDTTNPGNSTYWYGDMSYPSIDTFKLSYTADMGNGVVSRTIETYVKK